MENLTKEELIEVKGGEPGATYEAFHAAGKAVHDAIVSAYNEVVSWF